MKKSLAKIVHGRMPQKRTEPFWKGPSVDGITQSMMNLYLICPRRFYVPTIEGLKPAGGFNKNMEYGTMWHVCEEALAAKKDFKEPLKEHCKKLLKKFPLSQDEVSKWYEVCKRQFPVYVDYWKKHPDVKKRTPLLQEAVFKIPYHLPSGRVVILRGKFDSVDLIDGGIYLQENKVKGDIDELQLKKQLTFDLQTMTYLVALTEAQHTLEGESLFWPEEFNDRQIRGVRYNVIRRPLSGGKGSIRPHAEKRTKNTYTPAETSEHYYDRLLNDYIVPEPEYWFMRWKSEVSYSEIKAFKTEFLDPFLEQVSYWYETVAGITHEFPFDPKCLHYRLPYGIYNPIAEGGVTDFDEHIASGSTVGLEKVTTLFPELEEENA